MNTHSNHPEKISTIQARQNLYIFLDHFQDVLNDIKYVNDLNHEHKPYNITDIQTYLLGISNAGDVELLIYLLQEFQLEYKKPDRDIPFLQGQTSSIIGIIRDMFISCKIKSGIDKYAKIPGDELLERRQVYYPFPPEMEKRKTPDKVEDILTSPPLTSNPLPRAGCL